MRGSRAPRDAGLARPRGGANHPGALCEARHLPLRSGRLRLSALHCGDFRLVRVRACVLPASYLPEAVQRAPRTRVLVPVGRSPGPPGVRLTRPNRGHRILLHLPAPPEDAPQRAGRDVYTASWNYFQNKIWTKCRICEAASRKRGSRTTLLKTFPCKLYQDCDAVLRGAKSLAGRGLFRHDGAYLHDRLVPIRLGSGAAACDADVQSQPPDTGDHRQGAAAQYHRAVLRHRRIERARDEARSGRPPGNPEDVQALL